MTIEYLDLAEYIAISAEVTRLDIETSADRPTDNGAGEGPFRGHLGGP